MTEVTLAELTTMRVGGPVARVVAPETTEALIEAALDAWNSGDEWLILGGGSNLIAGDEGFDGTVIRVVTRGIEELPDAPAGRVRLRVQAGEPWDALVAYTVERGLTGIEALSGIPGSSGAAPIQNIGAYGQDVAETLVAIDYLDYLTGELARESAASLDLGYRWSSLKAGRQGLVVAIELDLFAAEGGLGRPIEYAQLASSLGVALGDRVPLADVRSTVLRLRASKGMVLDATDPDSVSAGSFFTNPLVGENFARTLPEAAPRWPVEPEPADVFVPLGEEPALPLQRTDHRVKLSAAWLIENAGIGRGFALPGSRAAISSKHTLAITNRGGASADEVSQLARYVQTRVFSEFGVRLQAEPVFVNLPL
jgi:UDP-N-acetylmuramate dehydrogenase